MTRDRRHTHEPQALASAVARLKTCRLPQAALRAEIAVARPDGHKEESQKATA